ncbi:MAG: glycosyltransferase family 4 protein [Anaerolineales bacterium]
MKDNAGHGKLRILLGLVFYPRGGSAQVIRYLSRALIDLGHEVHVATGSLSDGDPQHEARTFYGEIPLTIADYTEAWQGYKSGRNPISPKWTVPFHPSYEDKPGVPDRAFYKVNSDEYAALRRSWKVLFQDLSRRFQPHLIHLHHLNHMHLAAAEVFQDVPRASQLHGTEIKMLENLALLEKETNEDAQFRSLWRGIMTEAARSVNHFFAISPDVRQRGMAEFGIEERDITILPNGVDTSLFKPLGWTEARKVAFIRQILTEEPQGWDESGVAGSVRYSEADLEGFSSASGRLKPLLMFVGRFLDFKRVPLLVEAVAEVNDRFEKGHDWPPFSLLIWGGMPGEWEGRHPHTLARELGLTNVFFTGWLPHALLSKGLNLADVFVAPSYYEPFGQVFLEAMATGVPVIATRSGGPSSFVVDTGPAANGWFAEVDDAQSLAQTMYQALTDSAERKRRGDNALELVRKDYSWTEIARRYAAAYSQLIN